jgi:hypothetical protein
LGYYRSNEGARPVPEDVEDCKSARDENLAQGTLKNKILEEEGKRWTQNTSVKI